MTSLFYFSLIASTLRLMRTSTSSSATSSVVFELLPLRRAQRRDGPSENGGGASAETEEIFVFVNFAEVVDVDLDGGGDSEIRGAARHEFLGMQQREKRLE